MKSAPSINEQVESIMSRTTNLDLLKRLKIVHETLAKLCSKNVIPTISLLISHLNQNRLSISERSFYNSRKGGNLYREIYDVWKKHMHGGQIKLGDHVSEDIRNEPLAILDIDELSGITDPVLRYRVVMSLTLLRNTTLELENLKNVVTNGSKLSPISILPNDSPPPKQSLLNQNEFKALSNLLSNIDLTFNERGALIAGRPIKINTVLSSPGLNQALQKICSKY